MTDAYRRLTEQLDATLGELSALVSAEKYEEACEVRRWCTPLPIALGQARRR